VKDSDIMDVTVASPERLKQTTNKLSGGKMAATAAANKIKDYTAIYNINATGKSEVGSRSRCTYGALSQAAHSFLARLAQRQRRHQPPLDPDGSIVLGYMRQGVSVARRATPPCYTTSWTTVTVTSWPGAALL
jgi:hypothetical protein